jgi:hypothetical protein
MSPSVLHPDRFNAVLLDSPPLNVTQEQSNIISQILETSCSDSAFAKKAYNAIIHVLTVGITRAPTITSLVPSSVELGSPSFDLHIHGTGFNESSVIQFAGVDEPTTLISNKEITTGVNMDVWLGPDSVEVRVKNGDVVSDPSSFTFVAPESRLSNKQAVDDIKYNKELGHRIIDVPKVDHSIKSNERTPHEIAEDIRQKIKDKERKDVDSHHVSQIPSHQIQSVPSNPFSIPSHQIPPHFNPDNPFIPPSDKPSDR